MRPKYEMRDKQYLKPINHPPTIHLLHILLVSPLHTLLSSHTKQTRDQFGGASRIVICRNCVHDDTRVGVGVDDPDSRDMFNRTFPNRWQVAQRVEKHDEVRVQFGRIDHLLPEQRKSVGDSTGKPTFTNVKPCWTDSLRRFLHDRSEGGRSPDKQDHPPPLGNRPRDIRRASEHGQCLVKVNDCHACAVAVRIGQESGTHEGFVVSDMGTARN